MVLNAAVLCHLEAVILNVQKLVLGTVLRRMMLQASPCLRPFPFTTHRVGRKGRSGAGGSVFFIVRQPGRHFVSNERSQIAKYLDFFSTPIS